MVLEVKLSYPRGSGISVTAVSRTPITEEPPREGGNHPGPAAGKPVIEHSDNAGVDLTDGGGPDSEAPENISHNIIDMECVDIGEDIIDDGDIINVENVESEVMMASSSTFEATATRECPPQLQQPAYNHGQQRRARVRARLEIWRFACPPDCGHVCANRRMI